MATIETRRGRDGTTYRARVRMRGQAERTATFTRKTDARDWAEQIQSDLRRGRQAPLAEAMRHTLAELVDRYFVETLPTKESGKTQKNVRAYLSWWKTQIGGRTIANVTAAVVSEYRRKLQQAPARYGRTRGPASVNRYLAALSSCFAAAVKEYGWAEYNPVRNVAKLGEPKGRIRFLSDDERAHLLEACKADADLYAIVVLALSTGARQGEILGMRWPDVDLKRGTVLLHDTKNKERRTLTLAGPALALMGERAKVRRLSDPRVFPHRDSAERPLDISAAWYSALANARTRYLADCSRAHADPEPGFLADFRFHDLRHSCASYLAMSGASVPEIAAVLGHKTLAMAARYTHLSEQHVGGVVRSMVAKVFK
jgi:integrase